MVEEICAAWINEGRGEDCFWESWPGCPTPHDRLTPNMVMSTITRLTRERDEARAQVAAAYEVAIDKAECCLLCQDDIRALTPADAKAALEVYGREKMREALHRLIDRLRLEGQINPSLTYADAIEWAEYALAQMEALK